MATMRRRSGLTLTELLVALAILGIAGALLLSRKVTQQGTMRAENASDMKAVVDTARALALSRKEPLRVRVYADGLWSVVTAAKSDPLAAGTISTPPAPIDLTIDARGGCRATAGWVPREDLRAAFDAGKCRFDAVR
jgi:prepilin-type N-terminal cleavage/methylation domain-containing protein